ncbi:ATP binding microtubule motor family protein [Actinidia rufa]|uniref:Kinesin-like protein n=1 Tax=Actinidia rufa TaxID=165716 RepID=A0A7J0GN58_9ERIC|nr:ATP binding microtubule motor family protein [Actinidia rufa]
MPVSTRSQISTNPDQNDPNQYSRARLRPDQEETHMGLSLRNPHQGLKEKMKALTLFYEQQKQSSARFSTHPSVDLINSGKREERKDPNAVMREKENTVPDSTVTRTYVLPLPQTEESKENAAVAGGGGGRIVGFSCPRKPTVTMARKLSMGGTESEPRGFCGAKNGPELETILEKQSCGREIGSRILVFVRLRPMGKKEREAGSRCCVRIVNQRDVYLTEFASENDYLRLKRLRGRHFTFDASFPDSTSQQEVYSTTTAELVEAVLQGRNGSVFCYGATGAGKTYTMLGTVENPGVMVLAIKDLFTKIRQRSCDGNHVVHLSYLEVYNETVRDLLSPGRPLVLREDKQVMVEYRVKDASNNVVNRVGKLSLIDLAGSERALATDQRTLRSLEGANINKSLLALSSCINALVEGKKHIPYRNSKLTQLLKDSLGGACNTVMIANISPSNLSFGETQNTLHWADRAKEIRTKACEANEEALQVPESEADQAKLLLELQKENRELRVQLARQQQKLLTIQAQSFVANSSPAPSSVTSYLSPPPSSTQPNEKRKPRPAFLAGSCFTPESKKKGAEETVKDLQKTVKAMEAEMERMRKDHALQIKQKDDFIRDLSRKGAKLATGVGEERAKKRVVTRASLRPKEQSEGELKSPCHRFLSPAPTAKKRSFWDITTANSPSVVTLNGRKTRSHVTNEPVAAPSMLLQVFLVRGHTIEAVRDEKEEEMGTEVESEVTEEGKKMELKFIIVLCNILFARRAG